MNAIKSLNKKVKFIMALVLSISLFILFSSFMLIRKRALVRETVDPYPITGIAVSVIVPVYNVRAYIEKCLYSLLRQTLPEDAMEFIFVDDMSTDGSYEFLEEYAAKDSRIRLLRNGRNLGSGESRNLGMSIAKGEYIGFVDSDDSVEDRFYEKLYGKAKANDLDIVKGSSFSVNSSGTFESAYNGIVYRRLKQKRQIFEAFHYQHQTAIYRKRVLDEHPDDIRFGNYSNAQDCMFLLSYGFYAKTLGIHPNAKYYYLVRDDSASHTYNERYFIGNLLSINDRLDFLESHTEKGTYNAYLRTYRKIMKERKRLLNVSSIKDPKVIESIETGFNNTLDRIDSIIRESRRVNY